MKYNLIASELSMIIAENENDITARVYDFLEYYLHNTHPNIPKNAYFSIIDEAFKIYNKMWKY